MRFILLQCGMIAAAITAAVGVAGCSSSDEKAGETRDPISADCGSDTVDGDENGAADAPENFACTGLYTDMESKTLSAGVRPFAPAVPLWSDGAEKSRFIQLPDGAKIDAKNMDDWVMPVGTKVWKEFRHGDRKIETRFFWKKRADKWVQASYVWDAEGTKAERGEGKTLTVDGQQYSVPKVTDCDQCHRGRKDKLLGFEALSLAQPGAEGITLAVLAAEKRIEPEPARTSVTLPERGLGVLHVNCGVTCHNANGNAIAQGTGLRMRLSFDDVLNKPESEWDTFTTAIGIAAKVSQYEGNTRVTPSIPETSLVIKVMSMRGKGQMPPLATKVVDEQGVAAVEAWIRSLPAPVVTGTVAPAH